PRQLMPRLENQRGTKRRHQDEEVRIRDCTCRRIDRRDHRSCRTGGGGPHPARERHDTNNQVQADRYNVIVNRIGATPLDQATVVAVRPGQTYSRTDSGTPGDSFGTTVTGKTVYVDVK